MVQPPHQHSPVPGQPGVPPAGYAPAPYPNRPAQASLDPALKFVLPVGRTPLSIIAGYAGLLALFIVPAPLALGLGIWAVVDLKNKPDMSGAGRAWFAVIVGLFGSVVLTSFALG